MSAVTGGGPGARRRSDETGDEEAVLADRVGTDQPLERLPAGGNGRPVAVVLAIAATLAALILQPWGSGDPTIAPSRAPRTPAVAVVEGPAPAPTATVGPSPSSQPGVPGIANYVSLVDNEWSVVAMLASGAPASTEEPATPHGIGSTWSPQDPLLVLQQALSSTVQPVGGPGEPDLACQAPGGSRDRTAVHLPARRVAYLGVTFPGMDPRARVKAAILDAGGIVLRRVPSPVVRLEGMAEGQLYSVPSSGSGGTVLFATAPPRVLPSATYRFDVQLPGIAGHRYLYACIGP